MANEDNQGPSPSSPPSEQRDVAPVSQSPPPPSEPAAVVQPTVIPTPNVQEISRNELISRARTFLQSPQIQHQDLLAKRRFLIEKGLMGPEIDDLLRDQVYQPIIPPRTYPQPPPSSMPTLLLGLARLFSWIGLSSAAFIYVYYRFILPRITQTLQSRSALRTHHISLMQKLTASLAALKESQAESYAALPRTNPYDEKPPFAQCRTLSQTLKALGEEPDYSTIPPVTLLRCAIADLGKGKTGEEAQPTTEEIFLLLEGQIPWLATEDGFEFKRTIYDTLVACPQFVEGKSSSEAEHDAASVKWTYTPPPKPEPAPLVKSLASLESALPSPAEQPRSSAFQHTLQSLTEFTGYISSQVYSPYRPSGLMGSSFGLSPAEDALRKEIRSLKGIVLSRKTFMPTIPRAVPTRANLSTS